MTEGTRERHAGSKNYKQRCSHGEFNFKIRNNDKGVKCSTKTIISVDNTGETRIGLLMNLHLRGAAEGAGIFLPSNLCKDLKG